MLRSACFSPSALLFCLFAACSAPSPTMFAQTPSVVAASVQVHGVVNSSQRVKLAGTHVPGWATTEADLGAVRAGRELTNLHLILKRAPDVQAAFEQLLKDQQNPASPRYHQWLTAQQVATSYGVAPADVAAAKSWLIAQGLKVDAVDAGGVFITFSGTAAALQQTFSASLHNFSHDGASRYALAGEPQIPAALADVVDSVTGLNENILRVHSTARPLAKPITSTGASAVVGATPLFTSSTGGHATVPADFNTIYDVPTQLTGAGVRALVLINSRINPADITGFNSFFGANVAQPNTIVLPSSTDPGINSDSEGEADLDTQRILGVAPGTAVDLLVFSDLSDTLIQSALQYEISTLHDPVVNMSFGSCDNSTNALTRAQGYDSYFSTAAAQGISIFVSSGDSGAADCDANYTTIPTPQVLATNVLCASSYVTCVGGTEFNDTTNASSYWAATNNATNKSSALGYIPEGAWNEPTSTSSTGVVTYQASGTGGGVTKFPKPTWQTGVGVPADGFRDVPDVSFHAAGHDGYLICQSDISDNCASGSFKYIILGTSASAPAMSGVAALANQKAGAQGNLNPFLYGLAASNPAAFHDVTVSSSGVISCYGASPSICNNSTPSATSLTGGLAGYTVANGYDQATGLGSLDVSAVLGAVTGSGAVPGFSIAGTGVTVTAGATSGNTTSLNVTPLNGFTGNVALTCTVALASGAVGTALPTCAVSPGSVSLAANGAANATLTLSTQAASGCTQVLLRPAFGAAGGGLALATLLLVFLPSRRRRPAVALMALAAVGVAGTLSGCGGGGSATSSPVRCTAIVAGTTTGAYTVTVIGYGTSGTTAAHNYGTLTLTVR